MAQTALDRFGRVVIPKRSRDRFGLEAGAALTVVETEAGILLKVDHEKSPVREKRGVLVYAGEAPDGLDRAIGAQREERLRRLLPRKRR